VFASCVEHRPDAVTRFEEGCATRGFEVAVVDAEELREGYGGGGDGGGGAEAFRVVEVRRKRRRA
jgi:hypothetical protein